MELCFISSNIRFDNPHDGENSWVHRRGILSTTLLSHSPDVIATQEGRYDQLKDFEGILQDYVIVDDHRSWIKERMYPTFFMKKNAFELIKSEDVWLSETPGVAGSKSFGSAFPRLFTWMKIQPKDSNVNFLVINTHLDHVQEATRVGQIRVLAAEIKKVIDQRSHLVIMGDFNDSPESEIRQILEKEFPQLKDSWKLFNSKEETSHHSFKGSFENGSRIDWILVDEKLTVQSCFMEKRSDQGKFPSDHFPIVCKFKV